MPKWLGMLFVCKCGPAIGAMLNASLSRPILELT